MILKTGLHYSFKIVHTRLCASEKLAALSTASNEIKKLCLKPSIEQWPGTINDYFKSLLSQTNQTEEKLNVKKNLVKTGKTIKK